MVETLNQIIEDGVKRKLVHNFTSQNLIFQIALLLLTIIKW